MRAHNPQAREQDSTKVGWASFNESVLVSSQGLILHRGAVNFVEPKKQNCTQSESILSLNFKIEIEKEFEK